MKGLDAAFIVGSKCDGVDKAIDDRMLGRNGSGNRFDLVFEFDTLFLLATPKTTIVFSASLRKSMT